MKTKLIGLMVGAALFIMGCSALQKQETTQSEIPSAATLSGECAVGKAQNPPVRVGACDDYNIVQTACLALTQQPLVPAQALAVCTAQGYVITGSFTAL